MRPAIRHHSLQVGHDNPFRADVGAVQENHQGQRGDSAHGQPAVHVSFGDEQS